MKIKWYQAVFLTLFFALCLPLSIGMLIAGPSGAGANEQLSDAPLLKTDSGVNTEFLSDFSKWVNDRFFLRQELISVDHYLTAHTMHTSGASGVVLGKDGWLFYADTLADYTGTTPISERDLFSIGKNLSLMAEYCKNNGKQFLFVITPNKNSLYGEYMQNFGAVAEITNAQRLLDILEEEGVATVDLFTAFSAEDEILYFAHDSHWNSKGAALGADLINRAFGITTDYYHGDFSATEPHDGDLYAMLYPAFTDPEEDVVYGEKLNYTFATKATRPDAIVLNTESEQPGTLLAYRDSFGNLLFPYLADSYGTAKFSRSTTYDLTGEADYVLIELVERNLDYLLTYLPVMPAPVRQIEIPETVLGDVAVSTATRGDYVQLTGTLPAVDTDSCIYVLCGVEVYEAFCLSDGRFGVNLPQNVVAESVICTVGGSAVLYDLK